MSDQRRVMCADEDYEQEKPQPVNVADRSEMPAPIVAALRQEGDAWDCAGHHYLAHLLHGAADEIERLRAWKAEATAVIEGWERVFDMVPDWFLNDRLGRPKSETTAAYINRVLHP